MKMPEFKGDEEEEKSGTSDQQARDRMQRKKSEGLKLQIGELAESDLAERD